MNVTDHAMFGQPQNLMDHHRQFRRGIFFLASLLEDAADRCSQLHTQALAPVGLGGRPELVDDLVRTQLALAKLSAWLWDLPLEPTQAPAREPQNDSPEEAA